MSKRLQVLLSEAELQEIHRVARGQRVSVSEWVRQALRAATRRRSSGADTAAKLAVIRAATRHAYPVADMDAMLSEIERGYLGPAAP